MGIYASSRELSAPKATDNKSRIQSRLRERERERERSRHWWRLATLNRECGHKFICSFSSITDQIAEAKKKTPVAAVKTPGKQFELRSTFVRQRRWSREAERAGSCEAVCLQESLAGAAAAATQPDTSRGEG